MATKSAPETSTNGVHNRIPTAPTGGGRKTARGSDQPVSVSAKGIQRITVDLKLKSTSSLLMHKLGDITDKTKLSDEEMFQRAMYHCWGSTHAKPVYGLPAAAFNRSIEAATRFYKANKNHGDAFWKGAIRIHPDAEGMVPFTECTSPALKVDQGRNQSGNVVRTVRALVAHWTATLKVEFNEAVLPLDEVVNQLIHAGFHVGIGAFRPEKGGTFGTYSVEIG